MLFADLEVIIQHLPGSGYNVDMRLHKAAGELDAELALNVPVQLDLEALLAQSNDPEAYGRTLTTMVFSNQRLREAWIRARSYVEGSDLPLRVRLRLDMSAPELLAIRWETVFDIDQGLALARSERVMFSRYLDSGDLSRVQMPTRKELSALLVAVSPRNLARFNLSPIDVNAEAERVRRALGDIPASILVSGMSGAPVTLTAIIDALQAGPRILYLVCHGTMVKGTPYLALEDEKGEVSWVPGDELVARISDLRGDRRPVLVVLASCQSVGIAHDTTVPSALGPQLARAGVAAVVGMQGDAPMEMVAHLMPRFFAQLARDGEIDRALAAARTGLPADEPWWMPVLFLRTRSGRLWRDEPERVALPAAPSPTPDPVDPGPKAAPARQRLLPWAGGAVAGIAALIFILALLASSGMLSARTMPTPARIPGGASAAPSTTPEPALSPSPTSMPAIVPVDKGHLMVLVADLQSQGQTNRNYTTDIVDDLRQNLEEIALSDVEIRRYRQVVTTNEEAQDVARTAGAAVIVWGRYDENVINLRAQIGDREQFSHIPSQISDAMLRRTGNVNVLLDTTDRPLKSTAMAVLVPLNVLRTADGNVSALNQQSLIQNLVVGSLTMADVEGQGTAAYVYQFLNNYYGETEKSLTALQLAQANDSDNPILYVYRGVTYIRLGKLSEALEDARTADRKIPGFPSAASLEAMASYYQHDLPTAYAAFDRLLTARPDDWFGLSFRGAASYLLGDFAAARADAERAIAIGGTSTAPYVYAQAIALREGRVIEVQLLQAQVRKTFGGSVGVESRSIQSLSGQPDPLTLSEAAFDQLLNGQFSDSISSSRQALELAQEYGLPAHVSADITLALGFAQCNSGQDAEAEASYTQGLSLTPDFPVLQLLRAEVRARQGNTQGAAEDLAAVEQSSQADQLQLMIAAAKGGTLNCKTIFD